MGLALALWAGALFPAVGAELLTPDGIAQARQEAFSLYQRSVAPSPTELLGKLNARPLAMAAALEQLLSDPSSPPRLRWDAARSFIYFKDSSARQLELSASLLAEADFKRFDRSEWLYLCQKIGQRGADAMPCARRMLAEPSFAIPMLGSETESLGKDYALLFLLLSMDERRWNRELGDRLWVGSDSPSSQNALLTALFYAVSLRDDSILSRYSDDESRPAPSRLRANALLIQMSAMERNASPSKIALVFHQLNASPDLDEMELRALRRQAAAQVSRSALIDIERLTFLIRSASLPVWKERLRKLD